MVKRRKKLIPETGKVTSSPKEPDIKNLFRKITLGIVANRTELGSREGRSEAEVGSLIAAQLSDFNSSSTSLFDAEGANEVVSAEGRGSMAEVIEGEVEGSIQRFPVVDKKLNLKSTPKPKQSPEEGIIQHPGVSERS